MIGAWALAVGSGMALLSAYQWTPGAAASGERLPLDSPFPESPNRRVLLMFAHPHCPCTRASLAELEGLLEGQRDLETHVLFSRPSGFPGGWEETELWDRAASLPGVDVRADVGSELARLFGARTSGQVMLYGEDGYLLFSGGITAGRGHEGDNTGRRRLVAALRGQARNRESETPVFGCALFSRPIEGREAS